MLDNALEITGVAIEAVVLGLLLYRRTWRKLPFFVVYCAWALLSDAVAITLKPFTASRIGVELYLGESAIDFALQFCVLVELAWSVLRPLRAWLSLRALWAIVILFLAAGVAIWPFARISSLAVSFRPWQIMEQLQQTATILRVLFFVLLAVCSHLLSLGWRNRELQVATGFGFYSLVSLAVAALNTHQATATQFLHLYRIVSVSFLCSLLYWVFSFAQREAERQEFTPRMQSVLLTLAESAYVTRAALAERVSATLNEPDGY